MIIVLCSGGGKSETALPCRGTGAGKVRQRSRAEGDRSGQSEIALPRRQRSPGVMRVPRIALLTKIVPEVGPLPQEPL